MVPEEHISVLASYMSMLNSEFFILENNIVENLTDL